MTRASRATFLPALLLACTASSAGAEDPGRVRLTGDGHPIDEISGVARVGSRLAIVSDEGSTIRLLRRTGPGNDYVTGPSHRLLEGKAEADFEGLAARGRTIYALGSHSLKRRKLTPGAPAATNRERLHAVVHEPSRDRLFRLALDPDTGDLLRAEAIDLRPTLERHALLGPFLDVPGKENGVDLEGIALSGNSLTIGFRSPVLREGHVPVLVLPFDEPERSELRFVQLNGAGIRGLTAVSGGYLVLAVSGGPETGRIWFWDGGDSVPSRDRTPGVLRDLTAVPVEPGATPEGIALLEQDPRSWLVVVVYDGPRFAARFLRVSR